MAQVDELEGFDMMKTMTRILAATAAMGVAFAPIAAQANTRAGDSGAVYSVSNSAPGLGRSDEGEAQAGGFPFLIVFVVVAVGLGIYVSTDPDDDGDRVSPGA